MHRPNKLISCYGFSLVEIAVVLVILGLITGGVITGQSLIRASQLRAIPTEFEQFSSAYTFFEEKYYALPGDMPNATQYWTGGVTANGNGDLSVHDDVSANAFSERNMIWQHLALAGFIVGNFTGRDGNSNHHSIIGVNVPASEISGAGWSIDKVWGGGWPSNSYNRGTEHFLVYGAVNGNSLTLNPVLTPEEAWNIDKKVDDGIAGRGQYMTTPRGNNCTLATSDTNYDAAFALSVTSKTCALYFPKPFGLLP